MDEHALYAPTVHGSPSLAAIRRFTREGESSTLHPRLREIFDHGRSCCLPYSSSLYRARYLVSDVLVVASIGNWEWPA